MRKARDDSEQDQIDLSVSRDDDERGIRTKAEIPTIGTT